MTFRIWSLYSYLVHGLYSLILACASQHRAERQRLLYIILLLKGKSSKLWNLPPHATHWFAIGLSWHVKIYNSFKMIVSFLFSLANSTVTALLCSCWWFSFSPGDVVPSACCCWVPAITSRPAYMGALTQYWPAMVVPAKCQRSIQMLAFYLKEGAQLKVTKNGQSISLQPGVTWKSGKSKKFLEFSSDSRLFTFGISQALPSYGYREQQYAQT